MEWIDKIEILDQQIVLFLNGSNNPFFNQLMWLVTNPIFGIPFYLLFIYLIFKIYSYKKAIRVINALYKKKYIIKIFTSRFMGRNNDDPKKAILEAIIHYF